MKKSALITLSACALASFAVIRIKAGIRRIQQFDFTSDRTQSGMFV